jgi:hypothetical protein
VSGSYGGGTRRVRFVRGRDAACPVRTGEGRGVSGSYGGRDAACPVRTGKKGGGASSRAPFPGLRRAASPRPIPAQPQAQCAGSGGRREPPRPLTQEKARAKGAALPRTLPRAVQPRLVFDAANTAVWVKGAGGEGDEVAAHPSDRIGKRETSAWSRSHPPRSRPHRSSLSECVLRR